MSLPTDDKLKANISKEDPSHCQQLQNIKICFKTAYSPVKETNRRSHQNNKGYTMARQDYEILSRRFGISVQTYSEAWSVNRIAQTVIRTV